MQKKCISKLLGYDFMVEYKRKNDDNLVADGLSRQLEDTEGPQVMVTLVLVSQLQLLHELQQKCKDDLVVQGLM